MGRAVSKVLRRRASSSGNCVRPGRTSEGRPPLAGTRKGGREGPPSTSVGSTSTENRLRVRGAVVRAALQSRTIIVAAVWISLASPLPLLVGLLGLGAQRRFARAIVLHLAGKHDIPQPRLHGIKLRRGDDVLVLFRQNARNFLLSSSNSVWGWRVGGEHLWNGPRPPLLIGLDAFKEGHIGVWIVASLVHVLDTQEIGFTFGIAREFQESKGNRKLHAFVNAVAGPAIRNKDHCSHRTDLNHVRFGGLFCSVARSHVGNLVRHHACEFRFFLSPQDQAAVNVEETAGQRESIHFIGIDNLDRKGNLSVGIANQILPHAIHILRNDWVVNQLRTALHFLRERFAERNFVFQGVKVNSLADVAVPNRIHVVFRVFRVNSLLLRNRSIPSGLTRGRRRRRSGRIIRLVWAAIYLWSLLSLGSLRSLRGCCLCARILRLLPDWSRISRGIGLR